MWIESRPSGRWRGGYRETPSGRKIQRTFSTEAEARVWAEEGEREARAAAARMPDAEIVTEAIAEGVARAIAPLVEEILARIEEARRVG